MARFTDRLAHDEEGRRSIERRGLLGHYASGIYRTLARPLATRQILLRARLLALLWGYDEVANLVTRLPRRTINPVLSAFGATLGADVIVEQGLRLLNANRDAFRPLSIGHHVYIAWDATFDLGDAITIGDTAVLANRVHLSTHIDWAHSPLTAELYPHQRGPVRVGRGAFIGPNSTLLHGVTVGECAVVGGHSLVIHDIPPYTLAAGSPARVIRELDRAQIPPFDDDRAFIIPEGTRD